MVADNAPTAVDPAAELEALLAPIYRRRGDFDLDRLAAFAAGLDSANYATSHMADAKRCRSKRALLNEAAAKATLPGLVLEFGVFSGRSINHIAELFPGPVYGFDSFEGLPENWGRFRKGHFATALPAVAENVELVVGWFNETLPGFLREHPGDIRLLHVDCDLYSSTRTIFDECRDRIRAGTVIVFDEYFNYPGWRDHEFRAFQEFVAEAGLNYEYFGLTPQGQQVGAVITG
ncbi:class I SAM-dependent methyltransferase [Pararoseomonas sp. SCSIO 73927]|uniref:class I SAM-dependent methyltransferase n=1 Tax=Pararoseomonas sp. SCSIO 73927 TaxID=3114537 RepID=UPI0030CDC639